MNKNKIIILTIIIILIGIASILTTYALDITMTKGTSTNYDMSLTFDISGNINKELSIEAGKTKTFDIVVNNPYTDTITYGLAYKMLNPTTKPDNLIIAVTNISENSAQGTINSTSKKVISLIIINNSTSNIQIGLTVINGYKNGGDLIIPESYTIISDVYEVKPHDPIDNSGANYPDLVQGLIPVVYNETTKTWVKADTESSTSTYGWYDYTQKKWANAVLVSETNRSTYQNATAGTNITESDILAYYVWIPRYKYKVWNKDKVIGTDSYNAQTTGIDIVFESDTESTGTISCTYSYVGTESPNETCTGSNGDYYTHPAFTFGDNQVKGFWIGKYELSSETPTATDGGGSSTTLTPRILPNVNSWRNNTISNFSTVIQNMQASNNIYGLSTDKSTTDSHMLTNMEWGAVAYLTNSNYGRCSSGSCTEVTINNCDDYVTGIAITGIGGDTVSAYGSSRTCTTEANKYNGEKGVLASTTGNVYGVYDMSGGSREYVMGNMSSTADVYTFNSSQAGFASSWYNSNQKYVNTYANGTTYTDQSAYNRGRLGDATGEVVLSTGGSGGWYNDYARFPYSSYPWFWRGGGSVSASNAGVFNFEYDNGTARGGNSARAALV